MELETIIAKEEINMVLYVYKESFNMNEKSILKRLRTKEFWDIFETKKLWRDHKKLTCK